jgi:beta-barrel assembly-enhancing protease
MIKQVLPLLTAALALLTACNQTPDKIISVNPNELTVEDEAKIGEAFQLAITADTDAFPILDEVAFPEAYQYVTTLFGTMLNTAQVQRRQDFNWSVHILHDDGVRTAFFLPGGHFYIYTGLLKFLDSESELLGVIGHELYYVDSDLLVERFRQEFGGVMLGDILLENQVPELPEFAMAVPRLDFDEEKVTSADAFAVQLICPFLYEPSGIRRILEKSNLAEVKPLWLETRQAKFETRLQLLNEETASCGLPGVSNEENYLKFKLEYLP